MGQVKELYERYEMTNLLKISLVILLGVQLLFAGDERPAWVNERPVHSLYYIGIGSASKTDNAQDYRKVAKDDALQDLSSEIQINISGEFIRTLTEQGGAIEDDIRSMVQTKTRANLEGYDLAGSWENDDEYWVYYRLSKDLHKKLKKGRETKAKHLALDMYLKGRESEKARDLTSALRFYIQAMNILDEFIGEPLQVKYQGEDIYLQNALYSSLQGGLSCLQLKSMNPKIAAKSGLALAKPLKTQVVCENNESAFPVANLPLSVSFVKGKGQLVAEIFSDKKGIASCPVSKIESTDKIQIIKAGVSISGLAGEHSSPLIMAMLKNLTVPETRFILTVSGLTAYIESKEISLGQNLEVLKVEPLLKEALAEVGFSFSKDISQADLMINIEAIARKGSKVYNLFTSFADINLSITDLSTGEEVYKKAFNVKGIQLDFERAALDALEKGGKKIKDFAPEITEKVLK